ncbi:hypothetical protein NJ7G_1243 [Natrinema sp. J7-2]|nr:hypothetical protein NJ7G_1243 [Natrinema sp. J7-2]
MNDALDDEFAARGHLLHFETSSFVSLSAEVLVRRWDEYDVSPGS